MTPQLDASLLGNLRCFEVAGRQLSFTRAAAQLNLTQSAVSQQIRHLEERLGYRLFLRQSRGLELTVKGATLLEVCSRMISEVQQTLNRLGQSNAPLQINCLPSFTLQWLMPRLTEFAHQAPNIAVRLKAEFQTLDRHMMATQDIDLAVRYDPETYNHLHSDFLMDEYLIPVATPDYAARLRLQDGVISWKELVLLHDASPWAEAPEFIEWRTWLQAHMPSHQDNIEGPQFNLSSLAISAAINGQGIAMGRAALVYDELASGRLINPFGLHVAAPARYVMLRQSDEDPRVQVFAAWLTRACRQFVSDRQAILQ